MGELFSFTIVSGIIMLCLYLPYKLLLARERQHRFNRIVILGMYLTAVIVPLLPPVTFSMSKPAEESVTAAVGDISAVRLAGGIIEPEAPLWPRVILWIYIIGAGVMLLRFLWSYIRLVHIIRSGRRERRDGYTLVSTADAGISPFSWQRYVVVGDAEDAEESSAVMIHELRHLAARHSTDIIIAQIYAILVWYNPVSWLMTDELKTVHEYEADDAVIESGANLKEYQMLLIKKTAGARLPSLANSLNHSKLQKRITMMYQSKSRLAGKVGTLVFVPALAIGIAVVSIPAVASALSDASQATLMESTHKISKTLDNPKTAVSPLATGTGTAAAAETVSRDAVADNTEASAEPSAVGQETTEIPEQTAGPAEQEQEKEKVYVAVEQPANFPGGMKALMQWLTTNIHYPEDAYKANIQGRVIVKFIVGIDGSVSDATVLKGVSPSLDKEAVRVVMAMPKWMPGKNNGVEVASYYNIPITFRLSAPEPKEAAD